MPQLLRKLSLLISVGVGAVLFLAGLAKAAQPADTLRSLEWAFGPDLAVYGLAILVLAEVAVGSVLLPTACPKWAFAAATALFLIFVVWIAILQLKLQPSAPG